MVVLCRIQILCIAIIYITLVRLTVSSADADANSSCPLWHWLNKRSGHCECCMTKMNTRIRGIQCHLTNNYQYLEISPGTCMMSLRMSKLVAVCSLNFIKIKDTCVTIMNIIT